MTPLQTRTNVHLQWYEEAFEELKTVSNIDDLDRLVAVFMKQEDEHFSLFNYIQTVNQETDQQLEKTEELEVGGVFATWRWD